ncbi:MAG TPA: hypothetical protein VIG66_00280, partial [Noviherbaspirillum sp.]
MTAIFTDPWGEKTPDPVTKKPSSSSALEGTASSSPQDSATYGDPRLAGAGGWADESPGSLRKISSGFLPRTDESPSSLRKISSAFLPRNFSKISLPSLGSSRHGSQLSLSGSMPVEAPLRLLRNTSMSDFPTRLGGTALSTVASSDGEADGTSLIGMDSGTPPRTDEEVRETIQQARQARIQRELRQDFDKQVKSSHDASRTECEVDFDDWMKLPTQREFARAIGKEFDKWVKSQREAGLSKAVIAQALWKAPRIIQQERDKCAANGKLASFERLMQAQTGKRDVEIAEEILARQETLRTAFAYWVTVKPNWPESLDEAEETIEQARAASMQRGMENQFDDWKAKQREWSDAKGRFETNSDFEIAHSLRTGVKTILEEREKCECEGSLPEFEAWLAQALKEKLDVEIAEELRDAK